MINNKKHDLQSVQNLSNIKHNNNFIVIPDQIYVNNKSKLKFFCKTCNNIIEQRVDNHLNGAKCKICSDDNKFLKIDDVRKRVKSLFDDKYTIPDQSIVGVKNKIEVFCKTCNNIFFIRLNTLLAGHGCNVCRYNNQRLKIEDVISRSKKIHGDKFYISNQEIRTNDSIIRIYCKECNDYFYSSVSNHLLGYGCKKCANKKSRYTLEEIIKISEKFNGDKYIIEQVDYPMLKIFCKKCNKYFYQKLSNHLVGCGCQTCKYSRGEKEIELFLIKYNIEYISQKRFKKCKDKLSLPFDFYLPKFNTCIEFDGEQHFKPKKAWGGDDGFKIIEKHDKIKTDFCDDNHIKLIRIKYTENASKILEKHKIHL